MGTPLDVRRPCSRSLLPVRLTHDAGGLPELGAMACLSLHTEDDLRYRTRAHLGSDTPYGGVSDRTMICTTASSGTLAEASVEESVRS